MDYKKYNERLKEKISKGELVAEIVPPKVIPPLFKHQEEAVLKAQGKDCFGLFFAVGTGKTRTCIAMIEDKWKRRGFIYKTLILTPLIVVKNFQREIDRFGTTSEGKSFILSGTPEKKIKTLKEETLPICITNYETMQNKAVMDAIKKWNPQIVVADELHKLKDPSSLRTKNCQALSDHAVFRIGLSGTPVLNSEMDLFSQIKFLDHGRALGSNFFVFRAKYFYDENANKPWMGFKSWKPRPNILPELKRLIEPFTMSVRTEEALDLPDLTLKEVHLDMEKEQERCYLQMKKSFIAFLKDKACTADLAITKSLRLLQITSGFIKFEDGTEDIFFPNPKAQALEKLLEDITPTDKVIVWCTYKKNYAVISDICKRLKIPYSELTGETVDRQSEIDKFQNDASVRVMIANPSAGGIGINLTQASYMIYYSRNFSLGDEIQSEARCYRSGSEIHKKIVRIDLICKNSIDTLVHEVLKEKRRISDSVITNVDIFLKIKRHLEL